MISFSTKLHILLIMIVIGFGLYMFLLFKEIRLFQDEIDDMRSTLELIKAKIELPAVAAATAPSCAVNASSASSASNASNALNASNASPSCAAKINIDEEDDDDDDASVTSNEIKNILTNISIRDVEDADADVDADADDADSAYDVASTPTTTAPAPAPATQSQDIATMSLEKLQKVNYDDLRKHLRTLGHNIKGTKPDLIKKIQELQGNA